MSMNKGDLEFIKGIYKMSDEELIKLYMQLKKNKDNLSKWVADVLLNYTITDSSMSLTNVEIKKLYSEISKEIKSNSKDIGVLQVNLLDDILTAVIKESFKYWNYNIDFKDVRDMIDKNFKGKHFSDRIWDDETKVNQKLNQLMKKFLDGKINVNQIKREIENTFNTKAYNAKRLVTTEVARIEDEAFKRFCIETGVKRIQRNEILDSKTCNDCAQYHEKVYEFNKAPELPVHPMCRGFYSIIE